MPLHRKPYGPDPYGRLRDFAGLTLFVTFIVLAAYVTIVLVKP